MSSKFRITPFKPAEVGPNKVWIILGPRGSGKSVLLRQLMYIMRDRFDFALGMTNTRDTADMFRTFLPHHFVFDQGYDDAVADNYLQMCKKLDDVGKVRHSALLEDDVMGDSKFLNSTTQKEMHFNGRHWNQTLICTSQNPMCHRPNLRSQADVVISMAFTSHTDIKKLYEHWFSTQGFEKVDEFAAVFRSCTENFGCIVLDRTSVDKTVNGCIHHYRVELDPPLPPFRIGRPIFFLYSEAITRADEEKKHSGESTGTKVIPVTTRRRGG